MNIDDRLTEIGTELHLRPSQIARMISKIKELVRESANNEISRDEFLETWKETK